MITVEHTQIVAVQCSGTVRTLHVFISPSLQAGQDKMDLGCQIGCSGTVPITKCEYTLNTPQKCSTYILYMMCSI